MSIAAKVPSPRRMLDGVPSDTRVVIAGVTWEFYDRFSRAVRDGDNCRIAFDGKDIEMMTLGPLHERYKTRLDTFISIVADELAIKYQPQGSTTWKHKNIKRGVEPDLCFYFDSAKLLACAIAEERGSNKVEGLSQSRSSDRSRTIPDQDRQARHLRGTSDPGALACACQSRINRATCLSTGTYAVAERSRFLPVRSEDITRWVFAEYARDPITWKQRLREWVRTDLV